MREQRNNMTQGLTFNGLESTSYSLREIAIIHTILKNY